MRRLLMTALAMATAGCNCISLQGALCASDTECGPGLTCVGGCCDGCGNGGGAGGAGGGAGGGAATSSITFVNADGAFLGTSSASFALPRPQNVQTGDVLVAMIAVGTNAPLMAPPGFAPLRNLDTLCSSYQVHLFTHPVELQDGTTFVFTLDGGSSARWVGVSAAYHPVRASAPALTSQLVRVSVSGSDAGFTVPSVTVSGDNTLGIVLVHHPTTNPATLAPPPGLDERYDTGFSGIYDAPAPRGSFAPGQIVPSDGNGSCGASLGVVVLQAP